MTHEERMRQCLAATSLDEHAPDVRIQAIGQRILQHLAAVEREARADERERLNIFRPPLTVTGYMPGKGWFVVDRNHDSIAWFVEEAHADALCAAAIRALTDQKESAE